MKTLRKVFIGIFFILLFIPILCFNRYGAKFFENSFGEYIAVHNYENVINMEYYFEMFQPDCVIFEVAEYAVSNAFFLMMRWLK